MSHCALHTLFVRVYNSFIIPEFCLQSFQNMFVPIIKLKVCMQTISLSYKAIIQLEMKKCSMRSRCFLEDQKY